MSIRQKKKQEKKRLEKMGILTKKELERLKIKEAKAAAREFRKSVPTRKERARYDKFGRSRDSLIKKEDVFYSYRKVYDEGARVDDYNVSAFYKLYHGIWDDENNGYWLSDLVEKALMKPDGIEGEFLTQDLRITDYKFYTFEKWE